MHNGSKLQALKKVANLIIVTYCELVTSLKLINFLYHLIKNNIDC